MKIIDLYGFKSDDINQLADMLAHTLHVEWELHHSSFMGNYHLFQEANRVKLILKPNFNEEEGELVHPEFSLYPLLLEVVSFGEVFREIEMLLHNTPNLNGVLLRRNEYE